VASIGVGEQSARRFRHDAAARRSIFTVSDWDARERLGVLVMSDHTRAVFSTPSRVALCVCTRCTVHARAARAEEGRGRREEEREREGEAILCRYITAGVA